MTYIVGTQHLGSVQVQVPTRTLRPREATLRSPHTTVSSPEMADRLLRPRGSNAMSPARAKRHLAQVLLFKGQQGDIEKRLVLMVSELKNVVHVAGLSVDQNALAACRARKRALEVAIDALIKKIKALSLAANEAALKAVVEGASQAEVIAVATSILPTAGNTVVVESATVQVTPAGTIVPGPDAKVTTEPVVTEPNAAPDVAVPEVPIEPADGSVSAGKVVLGLGAAWLAWCVYKGNKAA